MPPEPVILHYTINPTVPPPDRPSAWDIEVKMEDTSLKNRMAVTLQASKDSIQDLSKLDDEVTFSFPQDWLLLKPLFLFPDRPSFPIST